MKRIIIGLFVILLSFFITGCGCEKQTFNVTFDTDGGSEIKSQIINKGDKIAVPSNPEKEGYTFDGWYYNGEKFDFSKEIDGNISLEARWSKVVNSDIDDDKKFDFKLSKSKVTLNVGKSITIKITTDSNKKATWKSSNEKVAVVKNGKITAKSVGKATITVTVDGISKTVSVVVVKKGVTTTTNLQETSTKKVEETTKKIETTKKVENLSWDLQEVEGSDVGQAKLYLIKDGKKVSGTCTIITKTGETVDDFAISASGYPTNAGFIKNITNIKID